MPGIVASHNIVLCPRGKHFDLLYLGSHCWCKIFVVSQRLKADPDLIPKCISNDHH